MKGRRHLLKFLLAGIFSFFGYAWHSMILRYIASQKGGNNNFPFRRGDGVLFHDDHIVISANGKTVVYSSHCTHLGCKINKAEGGRLVCPCHGSEYDMSGRAVKGPAYKNLKILPHSISEDGMNIIIKS